MNEIMKRQINEDNIQ